MAKSGTYLNLTLPIEQVLLISGESPQEAFLVSPKILKILTAKLASKDILTEIASITQDTSLDDADARHLISLMVQLQRLSNDVNPSPKNTARTRS